jgi:hypothetical protein
MNDNDVEPNCGCTRDRVLDEAPSIPLRVDLCPNADLTLLVGDTHHVHRFKISRNTLCMASSVFRAMLVGKFLESQEDEVELEGDDPRALLTVLRIAHLRCSEVRRTFTYCTQLVDIATICDKYDLVAICRPFVSDWVESWLSDKSLFEYEERLWIAWVFGYEQEFTRIADHLRFQISIGDDGFYMFDDAMVHNQHAEENLPPGIIGEHLQYMMLPCTHLLTRTVQKAC